MLFLGQVLRMPLTRSASRTASVSVAATTVTPPARTTKRSAASAPSTPSKSPKKARTQASSDVLLPTANAEGSVAPNDIASEPTTFAPAVLSFSFEEAKSHLINVDARFQDIFQRMPCKPFEHLEQVDPFRALVTSILGQQIAWQAARSIQHKFIRLFDQSIPEKPTDPEWVRGPKTFFPTAKQVAASDIATLRTAGLSQRKAEYVQDLAARFADGRLSTQKLLDANDDELAEMLIEVRGIGRWTVDMFAIFSLRRPDILPVGDLGVQRGVLRWFLSLHSPQHNYTISPKKLPKAPEDEGDNTTSAAAETQTSDADTLPVVESVGTAIPASPPPDASSIPPVPMTPRKGGKDTNPSEDVPMMPVPFTPSINRVLAGGSMNFKPPLPEGMTVAVLKSRHDAKKKVKGAFLTPKEMEDLTECWRPYRSLAVYYMWALVDGDSA